MKKKIVVALMVGGALAVSGGVASASEGVGNGAAGCALANGASYENPAEMLKALAVRDGSFQNTVDKFNFGTVGNLIGKKCGA